MVVDGKLLWDSGEVRAGANAAQLQRPVVDVRGVRLLSLRTHHAGPPAAAAWANALVQ